MGKRNDIKVNAPASTPHVCYIPREYAQKVAYAKKKTGKSLYRILCVSAGESLSTKEDIYKFKNTLRSFGYKTIGEWAVVLLDVIYENHGETIPTPFHKKKEDYE